MKTSRILPLLAASAILSLSSTHAMAELQILNLLLQVFFYAVELKFNNRNNQLDKWKKHSRIQYMHKVSFYVGLHDKEQGGLILSHNNECCVRCDLNQECEEENHNQGTTILNEFELDLEQARVLKLSELKGQKMKDVCPHNIYEDRNTGIYRCLVCNSGVLTKQDICNDQHG